MGIHASFWKERNSQYRVLAGVGAHITHARDANRKRCYAWENKHLRPLQTRLEKQAAKGYARLCVKIAIRKMREMGIITTDHAAENVRASFKSAFTQENIRRCDASEVGSYFAKWGWTDVIIAHEIAHWADRWAHKLAAPLDQRYVAHEGHGPRWRGWFVYILAHAGLKTSRNTPEGLITAFSSTLAQERLAVRLP